MRAGVEGWLHVPVRGGESVDDELIGIVRERITRNDHPVMWMTPSLHSAWMMASWVSTANGHKPAWLDDQTVLFHAVRGGESGYYTFNLDSADLKLEHATQTLSAGFSSSFSKKAMRGARAESDGTRWISDSAACSGVTS